MSWRQPPLALRESAADRDARMLLERDNREETYVIFWGVVS